MCRRHAKAFSAIVHGFYKQGHATWICSAKRVCGTIFTGHQGQVQQVTSAKYRANSQTRGAALFGIHIILCDGDHFALQQVGIADDQTGHQFGE